MVTTKWLSKSKLLPIRPEVGPLWFVAVFRSVISDQSTVTRPAILTSTRRVWYHYYEHLNQLWKVVDAENHVLPQK